MSSQKYYNDSVSYYDNVGHIYYTPVAGGGSPNPQIVRWMSSINLSRTSRSKRMYINPEGYNVQSELIQITQDKSGLLLILNNINWDYEDGSEFPAIEDTSIRESACTYYVQQEQLKSDIDVVILTNGNVIDVSVSGTSSGIIDYIATGMSYYKVVENDIPMFPSGNNPINEQEYQKYPSTLQRPLVSYIGKALQDRLFIESKSSFDVITCSSGNTVSDIDITSGGVLYREVEDYSKTDNLVAVKLKVHLSDQTQASRLIISTAAYDSNSNPPVESGYSERKLMIIEFRLSDQSALITGSGDINFNEAGVSDGEHYAETEMTATIPWYLGETDEGSSE